MTGPTVLLMAPGATPYLAVWRPSSANPFYTVSVDPKTTGPMLLDNLHHFLIGRQLTYHQLSHIGVMAGPASYTHLRVWVVTANTLAWTQGITLFGFAATAVVPETLPELIRAAKLNTPLWPVYPHLEPSQGVKSSLS